MRDAYQQNKNEIDALARTKPEKYAESIEKIINNSEAKRLYDLQDEKREQFNEYSDNLRKQYDDFVESHIVEDEYDLGDGIVVKTQGERNPSYWTAYKDGVQLTKRNGKDLRDNAITTLKERLALPTFKEWLSEQGLQDEYRKRFEEVYRKLEDTTGYNMGDVEKLNSKFNEELQRYEKGELPQGHRFDLGHPSEFLRSAGFDDLPISMRASLLGKKAGEEKHPFEISEVKDMVKAIQKPIAILHYTKDNMRNLIVDVKHGDKHFLVGVTLNYDADGIEINSVSGLFPKESHEWIKWIQDGKAIRIDQKEKVQDLINSLQTNPAEAERIGLNLNQVAKIVQNFENPKLKSQTSENDGVVSEPVPQYNTDATFDSPAYATRRQRPTSLFSTPTRSNAATTPKGGSKKKVGCVVQPFFRQK